jgi:hypothetical protein
MKKHHDTFGWWMTNITAALCGVGALVAALNLNWTAVLWLLALIGQLRVLDLLKLRQTDSEMMELMIDEINSLRAARNQQPSWSKDWLEDTGEI